MKSIFHRRSVRKFLDIPVDEQLVEKMLKAAMAAPSAMHDMPWEYYVVTNPDKLQELAKVSPYTGCTALAPLAFVACYRKEDQRAPEYAHINMSASVENLLLEADYLRLGAVWLGIAPIKERMENVHKALDIPDNLEAFAIIPCGYPEEYPEAEDRYDASRVHIVE